MNRSSLSVSVPDKQLGDDACLHCGNEIPENCKGADADGFCCSGCRYVYEILHSMGLEQFYDIRDYRKLLPVNNRTDPDKKYSYLNQENFKKIYKTEPSCNSMKFYIDGISCSACLWLIEKTPDFCSNISDVSLNMSENVATVHYVDDHSYHEFPEALGKFGFIAHPVAGEDDSTVFKDRENRNYLYRIAMAAVCAGNIMLLSVAKYAGASAYFASTFDYINLILSIPVVTYCSWNFYRNSFYSLINFRPSVDVPAAFVVLAGWILSTINLAGNGEVYYDSITVFVFLLLISRYLLKNVRNNLDSFHHTGISLFSESTAEVRNSRTEKYIKKPVSSLEPGDIIALREGERLQADSILLSPSANLNLSVLTGESIPQFALRGDYIYAGTIVESDDAEFEVDKKPQESRISRLIRDIEDKNMLKSTFTGISDRYSTIFTSLVGAVSLASFLSFHYLHGSDEALRRTIAFILIACPCAFVFTLPVSAAYSLRSALSKGIIIKNPEVLEKIRGLKNIFFDKTGTITRGKFSIIEFDTEKMTNDDLEAIFSIQKRSNHPIARSIINHFSNRRLILREVSDFSYLPARGISGVVNGNKYEFSPSGTRGFGSKDNADILAGISVYKNGKLLTDILLGDSIKQGGRELVNQLENEGYNVFILSGDREFNVKSVSHALGIHDDRIYWEKTPEEKREIITRHGRSMMIGDGMNDAAAISASDIGVSIQGSLEESLKLSDIYLLHNNLSSVKEFIKHGLITRNCVVSSIVLSIIYNLIAGSLALSGFINPLAAAVLMPASSLALLSFGILMQKSLNSSGDNRL